MKTLQFILLLVLMLIQPCIAQHSSKFSNVWVADNGDGTYKNPIIHADYSDPDAIRVGDDYYMTASSFNCVPGLPILHSNDLVNWELINYALAELPPFDVFDKPQHGNGVWAPCIRYYDGEFYIYYPDPDFGIYMVKTKDPEGKWSEPVLVKEGKGLIDPTPLWDDDGKAYLVYAYAGSRAGIKSILVMCTMNQEGSQANNDEVLLFDGHEEEPTIEGPKIYKRNGYYYIFAPAGGVKPGWQTVLRSKYIYGPYEKKRVLAQGSTDINGPHQGAWVQTQTGEDWFIHFQDKGVYGRVVHLQPMQWINDWPVIGVDPDGDGIGEPVLSHKKPDVGKTYPIVTPPDTDEFNKPALGLQWQWHANKKIGWGFPTNDGYYRMFCRPMPKNAVNLYAVPNLLLQKFPSEHFTATAKITFNLRKEDERAGLIIMGLDYSLLQVELLNGKLYIAQAVCKDAPNNGEEVKGKQFELEDNTVYLGVNVKKGGVCDFYYGAEPEKMKQIGTSFTAIQGKWIGAKLGFFAVRNGFVNDSGSFDIDWIRFEP